MEQTVGPAQHPLAPSSPRSALGPHSAPLIPIALKPEELNLSSNPFIVSQDKINFTQELCKANQRDFRSYWVKCSELLHSPCPRGCTLGLLFPRSNRQLAASSTIQTSETPYLDFKPFSKMFWGGLSLKTRRDLKCSTWSLRLEETQRSKPTIGFSLFAVFTTKMSSVFVLSPAQPLFSTQSYLGLLIFSL